MAKKVLIILADGFEEMEALTPIDILRRAGVDITIAGLDKKEITSTHEVKVIADVELKDAGRDYDIVILPGGLPGADNLHESSLVNGILKEFQAKDKWIAAICASPSFVLQPAGIVKGKSATCYPGAEGKFSDDVNFKEDIVVVDGKVITSRGPATALAFSLEIVKQLLGTAQAEELKTQTLYNLL